MKLSKRIKKYAWELAKKIKGTPHIIIRITTRCNLRCPYCSIFTICEIPLDLEEQPPEYWIKEMDKFDTITISGGDPSVYKDVHKIVNALIEKGKLVKVITNLVNIDEWRKATPSWRLFFVATYHDAVLSARQKYSFVDHYRELSKKHPVVLKEMRKIGDTTPAHLKESKIYFLKETREQLPTPGYFPDGSIEEGEAC